MSLSSSSSPLDQLVDDFQSGRLPKDDWTHEAHLRVGAWHVLHFGPEEALERLRTSIRRLNGFHGVANTDSSGYHETLTRFYVVLIADLASRNPGTADELADRAVEELGDRKLPLSYYSRESLFSKEARLAWAEPDLKPLPGLESP